MMLATFLLLNNQQLALGRQHIADGDWLSEARAAESQKISAASRSPNEVVQNPKRPQTRGNHPLL